MNENGKSPLAVLEGGCWGEEPLRMRVASTLAALSLLLIFSATFTSSPAADYTKVGVKQGDLATYSIAMSSGTREKSETWPVTTLTVHVENLTAPLVTVNMTLYYSNGSVYLTRVMTEDIAQGWFGPFVWWTPIIVAANLLAGDKPDLSGRGRAISETTQMMVAGYNRTVNFANAAEYSEDTYSCWWDKATGLLVKFMLHMEEGTGGNPGGYNPVFVWSYNWTLVSTTAFRGSTDSVLYVGVGLGAAIAIIAGVAVVSRRKAK
jgi:hypothetical protein